MTSILEFIVKLGPTLVAIAAIIVTFLVAKRQVQAATVLSSRQRWSDSLLDNLSRLIGIQSSLSDADIKLDEDAAFRALNEFDVLHARIALMLTPSNEKHEDLLKAILEYHRYLYDDPDKTNAATHKGKYAAMINAGRVVIAKEWSKIKRGD